MNEPLTHIDLFTGIGGFALAARWAGFRTITFCEKDEWCQKVLAKNFGAVVADATRWENHGREPGIMGSETESGGCSHAATDAGGQDGHIPIHPDIRTFPGHLYQGATLLTGGFPCQPFSCAGKRAGKADDRDLWPFMFTVIKDARPTWIIGENVAGFVKMELDRSISDLESEGYSVRTFIIPACATDAKHRRDRCWIVAHSAGVFGQSKCTREGKRKLADKNESGIVAHSERDGRRGRRDGDAARNNRQVQTSGSCSADECEDVAQPDFQHRRPGTGRQNGEEVGNDGCEDVADSIGAGLEGQSGDGNGSGESRRLTEASGRSACSPRVWQDENEWFAQSGMGRVASRIPNRVDRLKGLGNAIVPQVAYEIMRAIAEIENGNNKEVSDGK